MADPRARRRMYLYGATVAVAAGLLFAGYGITVPPDAATRLNGAGFLAGLGKYDEALEACDLVLREHPDSEEARVYRAAFLAMAGRDAEALAAYDDALAHTSGDELRCDLVLDRASVLLRAGRVEEFRRERDRLVALRAGHRIDLWEGLLAEREGTWPAAAAAYERALASRPADAQIQSRLYRALLEQGRESLAAGRYGEAQGTFDRAIEVLPRAQEAHLRAAEVRLATGDIDQATAQLREAGPRAPGVGPLLLRAATLLLERSRREEALDALAAALVADSRGVRALLQNETAWAAELAASDVRELLDTEQPSTRGALTADGGVIDDPRNSGEPGPVR